MKKLEDRAQKRRPLLIDRTLAREHNHELRDVLGKKTLTRVMNALRESKRFVLDNRAAEYYGRAMQDSEGIAANLDFAIPPFPVCYFEFPLVPVLRAHRGREPAKDADDYVGYLFDGPSLYVLAVGGRHTPGILPIRYKLNQPWTFEEELTFSDMLGISRVGLDGLMWGESVMDLQNDEVRALRDRHSIEILEGLMAKDRTDEWRRFVLRTIYQTSAGDLRNALALLLLINRSVPIHYLEEVPVARQMIRAVPSALLKHSIVRIKLHAPERLFERAGPGQGIWRREHDVRGHFCHDKKARIRCEHAWEEYGVHEWRCLKCDGYRWWRKAHRRGSRDKGQVTTEYEVKP